MQYGSPQTPGQYAPYPQMTQYIPPPKKKTKKRLAIVAAVSAACLASAGVYATTLAVTANDDAAGVSVVSTCDATVTTQTSVPVWVAAEDEWQNADLTVGGIDAACSGQTVYVQPLDSAGDAVGAGFNAVFDAEAVGHTTDVLFEDVDLPTDTIATFAVAIHES